MSWTLLLIIVLAIAILAVLKGNLRRAGGVGLPYLSSGPLFSPAERAFLGVLDQAVGAEHRVFGKVRVADVATVKPGLSNSARQGAVNRVGSKHFDFVVCRRDDLAVVCAVELNDRSHSAARAKVRDELLVGVCRAINLPLLVVPAKAVYSLPDLRTQFVSATSAATVY